MRGAPSGPTPYSTAGGRSEWPQAKTINSSIRVVHHRPCAFSRRPVHSALPTPVARAYKQQQYREYESYSL